MTTIEFDLRDEQAAAGLAAASGHLSCRYVNELDDPDGDGIVTTKPFKVTITNGVGSAEVLPTPDGNGLSVRSYVRGVRSRTVQVTDSPTAVQFRDLTELDPATLSPAEPPAAWTVALNDAVAEIIDAAPGALDTLNELAAALGDDANFATTVTNALAAKVATSRTVNGHALTSDVTVTKGDVGLGNVDNTADTAKPISTATQTALDGLDARLDVLELDTAPGKELGYAERTTSATSTAQSVAAATAISGLSVTVVGKGRPVDIEFYCASVTHSVANTTVSVGVLCNGNVLGPGTQYGATASASTTAGQGRSLCIKRRMVLADGVSYTFTVRAFALGVAGTSTLYAVADYEPLYLAVTAR